MDVIKVRNLITQQRELLDAIEREIDNNPTVNVMVNGAAAKIRVGTQEVHVKNTHVKAVSWIDGPEWPEAVESDVLCSVDDEDEKVARAESILDMTIETNLKDLRFLDYGCGDGYMAKYALERGVVLSVGYDPKMPSPDTQTARFQLVNRPEVLEPSGYDVILLYDVLDHCDDPLDVLHHVARLLAPGGTVYAACHPWTSRHGGHLYRRFNKAWAHVFLEHDDMMRRGVGDEFVYKLLRPQRTYRQWFATAGLTVRSEDVHEEPMERFLRDTPEIWQSLTRHFADERYRHGGLSDDDIKKIFEVMFVNYVLQAESIY